VWLAAWDGHPNVRGHELIANALFGLVAGKDAVLRLGLE
jgi:hypothetical protein